MTPQQFRKLALSFDNTEEAAHFDRAAFKVSGKRIFATMHEKDKTANLKLTEVDQSVFCSYDKGLIFPVPNKWGLQGWTTFDLKVPKEIMLDALNTAFQDVIKTKKKK
jgi:hypothetical protein